MTHYRFFDMVIYHDAIRWWLSGGELYDYAAPVRGRLGFTYPPFAAFVLMPAAAGPGAGGRLAERGRQRARPDRRAGRDRRPRLAAGGRTAGSVHGAGPADPRSRPGEPVAVRARGAGPDRVAAHGSRWTGVGVGIATAIKITPGPVHRLPAGHRPVAGGPDRDGDGGRADRVRPAARAGRDDALLRRPVVADRIGWAPPTRSRTSPLAGLLARTATAPDDWWLPLCLLALAAGLRRAWLAHRDGDEVAALTLVGLTGNLISPMSWTHHLVFLPVAIYLLVRTQMVGGGARRLRAERGVADLVRRGRARPATPSP